MDCYDEAEAEIFTAGLREVSSASQTKHSQNVLELSSRQRHDLLSDFDRIASNRADDDDIHFWRDDETAHHLGILHVGTRRDAGVAIQSRTGPI